MARQLRAPVPQIPMFRESSADPQPEIQEWIARFRTYMRCIQATLGNAQPLSDEYKKTSLELQLGAKAVKDLSRNPQFTQRDGMTYDEFEELVVEHFRKRRSLIKARVDFARRYQEAGETVHDYIRELRKIAEDCEFENQDSSIRTQLVTGTSDVWAQMEIMARVDLPELDEIQELLQASETASEEVKKLHQMAAASEARQVTQQGPSRGRLPFRAPQRGNFRGQGHGGRTAAPGVGRRCEKCGSEGHSGQVPRCRAIGKMCMRCGRLNHFAVMCRAAAPSNDPGVARFASRGRGRGAGVRGRGGQRGRGGAATFDAAAFVGGYDEGRRAMMVATAVSSELVRQEFGVQDPTTNQLKPMEMLVDTGVNISIFSRSMVRRHLPQIRIQPIPKTQRLRGANGEWLTGCVGTVAVRVFYQGQSTVGMFRVFEKDGLDAIGMNILEPLGCRIDCQKKDITVAVVQEERRIEREFPTLFRKDMGAFIGKPHVIQIRPEAQPVAARLRPIPLRMREAALREITKMDELSVWEPVDKAEWVHPLVVVPKKDGSVHLTTDLTKLNLAVIPDRFPLSRIKDIFWDMEGATVFSKLDLMKGYYHVPLAEESRDLTTTIMPLGLRRYMRLPMGLKDAASAFQQRLQKTLAGIPGTRVYIDDILIGGRTEAEHDERLQQVLGALEIAGFRLQAQKLEIRQAEVPAFGYLISAKGVRPSPDNTKAIMEAPKPQSVREMQRFLGMVNYLLDFIPRAAEVLEPLREMVRTEETFGWNATRAAAFQRVKGILAQITHLQIFSDAAPTYVTVDASDRRIGVMLSQLVKGTEHPVAFFSRALDAAQKNYSITEKECLASMLALEHWEELLLGRKFELRTDHQVVTTLLQNPKTKRQSSKFAQWQQRLADFEYEISYIPGPHNQVADYLSWMTGDGEKLKATVGAEEKGKQESLEAAGMRLETILEAVEEDGEYVAARRMIRQGDWQNRERILLVNDLRSMWRRTTVQGVLIRVDGQMVPPKKMVEEILRQAHMGHPGIVRMKQLLRCTYLWPRMTEDVERVVRNCDACQRSTKSRKPTQEPQTQKIPRSDVPGAQWAVDITGPFPNGQSIVVAVDYASRFPEILVTKNTTAENILEWLETLWSRYGLPTAIVTDNGPQFVSHQFQQKQKDNDIHHYRIAVYNPQENGLVERFNRYLKYGMQTFSEGGWKKQVDQLVATYRFLLGEDGKSPLELFLNRKARSPVEPNEEKPLRRTDADGEYTGRSEFRVGDQVLVKKPQVPKGWSPWKGPVVVEKVLGRFTFQLSDGQVWNARKMKRYVGGDDLFRGE